MTEEVSIDLSGVGASEPVNDLLVILARTLPDECTACNGFAPKATSFIGMYRDPTGSAPWGFRLCHDCGEKAEAGGDARSQVLVKLEQRFLGETDPAGTA